MASRRTNKVLPIGTLLFRDMAGALAAMQAVADPNSGVKRMLGSQLSVAADANGVIARQAFSVLAEGLQPPPSAAPQMQQETAASGATPSSSASPSTAGSRGSSQPAVEQPSSWVPLIR